MDRIIKVAPEGMLFTDGLNYVKKIYLAEDADAAKWYEIATEEYEKIQEKKEKIADANSV